MDLLIYNCNELNDPDEFIRRLEQASEKRRPAFFVENYSSLSKKEQQNLAVSAVLDDALRLYGLKEREVTFIYGDEGKPYLKDHSDIKFNISHSGQYVVCGIIKTQPEKNSFSDIGVDIEYVDHGRNIQALAKRLFTEAEIEYIEKCSVETSVQEKFYILWTIKEAFAKFKGYSIVKTITDMEVICENEQECEYKIRYDNTVMDVDIEIKKLDGCVLAVVSKK